MTESIETISVAQVSQKTGVSKNKIKEWQAKGFLPGVRSISVGSRFHRGCGGGSPDEGGDPRRRIVVFREDGTSDFFGVPNEI